MHAVITVEAHQEGARTDIERAIADLLTLLEAYAGSAYSRAILSVQTRAI
jgi:hypothetical protein